MSYYLTLLRLRDIASLKSNIIQKGKKYIKPGQKAPKGVHLHKGPKGGTYYIIEDRHTKFEGKHHELVRSKGVTKDQWDEIRQKYLDEGAESVEFLPQPEYGGIKGKKLYNIYVRRGDTDEKVNAKLKVNKDRYAARKAPIEKMRDIIDQKTEEEKKPLRLSSPDALKKWESEYKSDLMAWDDDPILYSAGDFKSYGRKSVVDAQAKKISDKAYAEWGERKDHPSGWNEFSYLTPEERNTHGSLMHVLSHNNRLEGEKYGKRIDEMFDAGVDIDDLIDTKYAPGDRSYLKKTYERYVDWKTGKPVPIDAHNDNESSNEPLLLTEEEYLSQNGASFMEGAEPALHRTPGWKEGDPKRHKSALKVLADMQANDERREALRKEYADKVGSGEIRPPTDIENKVRIANEHEDNMATQAARRLLTKRGIDWKTGKKLPKEESNTEPENKVFNKPMFDAFKAAPKEIPLEITKETVGDDWIRLGTSNKVGRARNLATERGVPMNRIHEIYQEAEKEATGKYLKHKSEKEFTEPQKWALYAMYSGLAEKIAIDKINAEQPPAVEEGSVKAFLLSGKTYPLKGDIKYHFQGKWNRDAGGWLIHGKHADAVKAFAEKHGLDLEETEAEGDTFRMRTPDERRQIRSERNQRKAVRIRESAEKKMKEGEASYKAGHDMFDVIPFGQPILVGHHSEKRDRNYRERAWNKMDKGIELVDEAKKQLNRAKKLEQTPRMKGDTARAREAVHKEIRDKAKNEMIPGKSQVNMGWLHGKKTGIVVKFNDKSALVFNPETKHSYSIPLVNLSLIDHEGKLPDKKELQQQIKPERTISKQEWDKWYPEDKRLDQHSRIRYIREGSIITGKWIPVKVE